MSRPRTVSDAHLLTAASSAIGRHGPSFTLADVGREAGVAAATLVQRFGSKAAMLAALAKAGSAQGLAAMRDAAAASPPGAAAVTAALRAAAVGLDDPATAPNHLAQLGADLADPVLRASVRDDQRAVRDEVARLVRDAPGLGHAPSPADAADALVAMWNGTLLAWSLDPAGDLGDRLDAALGHLITAWTDTTDTPREPR
jgi:AcrR family transcriptional regulator